MGKLHIIIVVVLGMNVSTLQETGILIIWDSSRVTKRSMWVVFFSFCDHRGPQTSQNGTLVILLLTFRSVKATFCHVSGEVNGAVDSLAQVGGWQREYFNYARSSLLVSIPAQPGSAIENQSPKGLIESNDGFQLLGHKQYHRTLH